MDVEKALEMLMCAVVNCENAKRWAPGSPCVTYIEIVKTQIEEAIHDLNGQCPL